VIEAHGEPSPADHHEGQEETVPQIAVDDEVYAALRRSVTFQEPNDIMRMLLGLPRTSTPRAPSERRGLLAPLLAAQLIEAGDTLVSVQGRDRTRFTAWVDNDGYVVTKRGRYHEPSLALSRLVGHHIDGWRHWRHETHDKSLRQLRGALVGTYSWRPPGTAEDRSTFA
jgi:Restriction Enzyme Adenine Methylase Associated